jgi:hypothetical protein
MEYSTDGYLASEWVGNCNDWASLMHGEYILNNNVWNKSSVVGYTQCIYTKETGGKWAYKWTWDWPDMGDWSVRAYPEVIFGWKPWMTFSTTPKLPIKVADAGKIKASFNITQKSDDSDGLLNTAFDIWIVGGPIPTPENRKREIMIWIKKSGQDPAGEKIKTVRIGGEVYDLFVSEEMEHTYLAFAKRSATLKGEIPIGKFITYLAKNGYISKKEYVASIELGNEIRWGSGYTILRGYSIDVP